MDQILSTSDLSPTQQQFLYSMCARTYLDAGEELWFNSVKSLFHYPCLIRIISDPEVPEGYSSELDEGLTKGFIMYQYRTFVNKISLICHDGTRNGKDAVMGYIVGLLELPGWILEASGAVSWILRKLGAPIIPEDEVEALLDISPERERIEFNKNFDRADKNSHQYRHMYYKNGGVGFANSETLFGLQGCKFVQRGCDRKCRVFGQRYLFGDRR